MLLERIARAIRGDRDLPIDGLEPRALLDAPTATMIASEVTYNEWIYTVRYAAGDGIDVSTIDGADSGAAGPDGYSKLGQVLEITEPGDGSVVVRYSIPSLWASWNWSSSGTYNFGVAPGQVRSLGGDPIEDTGLGSFWHVWHNALVRLLTPNADTPMSHFETNIGIYAAVTEAPWATAATDGWGHFIVDVEGPNGFDVRASSQTSEWYRYEIAPTTTRIGVARTFVVAVSIPAPGGAMDWSDTGRFDFFVADAHAGAELGRRLGASFYFWWTAPRVDVLSEEFGPAEWRANVRYTGRSRIDAATVGDGDLTLVILPSMGQYWPYEASTRPTVALTLVGTPVVEPDGSVRAEYIVRSYSMLGWSTHETGGLLLRMNRNQVLDEDGSGTITSFIARRAEAFEIPAVFDIRTTSISATEFEFEVRWRITAHEAFVPLDNAFMPRLDAYGPSGVQLLTVRSETGRNTQFSQYMNRYWFVRTRVRLPEGESAFADGRYEFWLKPNVLSIDGVMLPATFVGGLVIDFP